jgi:hypothetical protein
VIKSAGSCICSARAGAEFRERCGTPGFSGPRRARPLCLSDQLQIYRHTLTLPDSSAAMKHSTIHFTQLLFSMCVSPRLWWVHHLRFEFLDCVGFWLLRSYVLKSFLAQNVSTGRSPCLSKFDLSCLPARVWSENPKVAVWRRRVAAGCTVRGVPFFTFSCFTCLRYFSDSASKHN